jgi:hypothetical protein
MMAGRCPELTALAGSTGMSAGVRARELAFVNGDREIAARFVLLSAVNQLTIEQRELILLLTHRRIKKPSIKK